MSEAVRKIPVARPTAELRTEIYTERPGGAYWQWREVARFPRAQVIVYTEHELAGEMALHGPRAAAWLDTSPANRFRVIAACLTTGATVGEWTWDRSRETNRWVPAGTPWVVWDDRLRVEALERQARKTGRRHPAA